MKIYNVEKIIEKNEQKIVFNFEFKILKKKLIFLEIKYSKKN